MFYFLDQFGSSDTTNSRNSMRGWKYNVCKYQRSNACGGGRKEEKENIKKDSIAVVDYERIQRREHVSIERNIIKGCRR